MSASAPAVAIGVKHLDHLNMSVTSFDETADWYRRVLGFEKVEEGVQNGVRWGVLRAGDAMLCVYDHPTRHAITDAEQAAMKLHTVDHFGLRITNRAAWEATVAREQVTVHYGGAVEWPHSTAWYIEDPSGHWIEVALWKDDTVRFA
jgi:catechol 2,3-dioxygenase-like lactoylglutathione lyase family enzyme